MNVGDVCSREVVLVERSASIQQAAGLMREHHVGSLLVVGAAPEGGQTVLGIVTDRDIAIEAVARGVDTARTEVARVANGPLAAVPASASFEEAIVAMKERGVRRLLVSSDDGALLGVVAADDLLGALGHEVAGLAHAVHKGLERERAERAALPKTPVPQTLRIPLASFS